MCVCVCMCLCECVCACVCVVCVFHLRRKGGGGGYVCVCVCAVADSIAVVAGPNAFPAAASELPGVAGSYGVQSSSATKGWYFSVCIHKRRFCCGVFCFFL